MSASLVRSTKSASGRQSSFGTCSRLTPFANHTGKLALTWHRIQPETNWICVTDNLREHVTDVSAPSSKHRLSPRKLSIWPACGTCWFVECRLNISNWPHAWAGDRGVPPSTQSSAFFLASLRSDQHVVLVDWTSNWQHVWARDRGVPRTAQRSTSSLASFRSDQHVVLRWLVECTVIRVSIPTFNFKWTQCASFDYGWYNSRRTLICTFTYFEGLFGFRSVPRWGAADAEIKIPSGENTELRRSPFKVWSRSVYCLTCYAYWQGFLPRLFLHFRSIHLHFFPKPLPIFPVLALANT